MKNVPTDASVTASKPAGNTPTQPAIARWYAHQPRESKKHATRLFTNSVPTDQPGEGPASDAKGGHGSCHTYEHKLCKGRMSPD